MLSGVCPGNFHMQSTRKYTLMNLPSFLVRWVSFLILHLSLLKFSGFSKLTEQVSVRTKIKPRNP